MEKIDKMDFTTPEMQKKLLLNQVIVADYETTEEDLQI